MAVQTVLVNVRFQPLKSILLITTNYFTSTESRNPEKSDWKVKLGAFVLGRRSSWVEIFFQGNHNIPCAYSNQLYCIALTVCCFALQITALPLETCLKDPKCSFCMQIIQLYRVIGKTFYSYFITLPKWCKLELMRFFTKCCWNKHSRQFRFIEREYLITVAFWRGLEHCRKNFGTIWKHSPPLLIKITKHFLGSPFSV